MPAAGARRARRGPRRSGDRRGPQSGGFRASADQRGAARPVPARSALRARGRCLRPPRRPRADEALRRPARHDPLGVADHAHRADRARPRWSKIGAATPASPRIASSRRARRRARGSSGTARAARARSASGWSASAAAPRSGRRRPRTGDRPESPSRPRSRESAAAPDLENLQRLVGAEDVVNHDHARAIASHRRARRHRDGRRAARRAPASERELVEVEVGGAELQQACAGLVLARVRSFSTKP
jgi:hypothetical protein